MIDAKQIEEMKRLAAELPKGPWSVESLVWDCDYAVYSYLGFRIATLTGDEIDAQFIAESRQFVPDIIATYEAQAEEIAKLREALEFYANLSNYTEYYESDYVKYGERGTVDILSDKGGKAKEALAWRNTTRK